LNLSEFGERKIGGERRKAESGQIDRFFLDPYAFPPKPADFRLRIAGNITAQKTAGANDAVAKASVVVPMVEREMPHPLRGHPAAQRFGQHSARSDLAQRNLG
jgi:hypothetical protein